MDFIVLKKRLSTFKNENGRLSKVSDELIMDLLRAWESWTGSSKEFYQNLGLNKQQLAIFIKKAKKLNKSGIFPVEEFKEIKINSETGQIMELGPCSGVEIVWNNGKVIRFSQVDLLVDFLKKAA
jgi:vacuolar-type H+-ATPase subunit D/Vma8